MIPAFSDDCARELMLTCIYQIYTKVVRCVLGIRYIYILGIYPDRTTHASKYGVRTIVLYPPGRTNGRSIPGVMKTVVTVPYRTRYRMYVPAYALHWV